MHLKAQLAQSRSRSIPPKRLPGLIKYQKRGATEPVPPGIKTAYAIDVGTVSQLDQKQTSSPEIAMSALPQKRTLVERSGTSVNASPKRGLPISHRVDDHADGLDHDLRVVDHDVVSRVRVGNVHRAGHERRELVLGRRVRSVDDRSEVPRRVRRQLTGLDEFRDDIDELVARREHDDRHGPWRCRGGRLVQGLIEILPFQIRIGRESLGRPGVDAFPDLPLLRRHLGAKLGREDVNEHDTFDFVRMLAGEDSCDRAAERVRGEDIRARHVGRLEHGDEVVDILLGTGRLGHRVAPAKGLVEVERTGSVVGAHPRRLLDFVVDRRTLLISSVPEVGRRVRTRDEQDGG